MKRSTFLITLGTAALTGAKMFAQASAPIAGKWHFVLETEQDPREFNADFTVNDGKVGGTFGQAEVKGTTSGDSFLLEFDTDSEVGRGTLKLDGKQADGALTGKWAFQTYSGTFKATRPASAEK